LLTPCFREMRERSPLLLVSARVAEADTHDLLRMNDDAPWERSFQFRPSLLTSRCLRRWRDCHYQHLARKRSEHTSMTADTCKRLAFQSLSVALQTANARMLRSRKLQSPVLPSSLNYQEQRASVGTSSEKPYKRLFMHWDALSNLPNK
jgi:hypothetical protein